MFNEGIIVCENSVKRKILKERTSFVNYKFFTLNQMIEECTFKIDKEGIFYLTKEYGITPEIAYEYAGYLKYISLFNDNPKFDILKEMYQKLKGKGFIDENTKFKETLKDTYVTILYYARSSDLYFLEGFLKKENCEFKTIEGALNKETIKRDVHMFGTVRDESRFVFSSIKKLLMEGKDISNIKIMGFSDEYDFDFRRLSSYYKIPINFKPGSNIVSTDCARFTLENLNSFETMEELVEEIRDKFKSSRYLKKIVNVINGYHLYNYKPIDAYDILKYEFKKTEYDKITYENGIELVDIETYAPKKEDTVFLIGFNLMNVPKVFKNSNYLDDRTLFEIGLDTAERTNEIEREVVVSNLNMDANYVISYKLQGPFDSYLPSPLISELGYNIIKDQNEFLINEKEDGISFAMHLDEYGKFGVEKDNFKSYIYDVSYNTYDNKFKGIDKETLDKYIPENLSIAYSNMKTFYKCPFEYYCNNILHIEVEDDKLAAKLGTLAHFLLEHSYEEGFDIEECFKLALIDAFGKEVIPTMKELFFSRLMEALVEKVIAFNKEHESLSKLTSVYREQNCYVKLKDQKITLFGYIDKMLVEEDENDTYIAVIDYKTGLETFKLENVKDGFNLQLPVYLYLAKHQTAFKNPKMVGLYLQKININEEEFRLQGYTKNDTKLIEKLDPLYESSTYIKSMKVTKSTGMIDSRAKLFNDEDEFVMEKTVEELLSKMGNNIHEGNFNISPVKINDKDMSCGYCKFKDICFHKYEDYREISRCNLYGENIVKEEKK